MNGKYDYIVIGSGPAGYVSAIKASQLGLRTLIVEKDRSHLGGTCLNEGCIPAKSLYRSVELYSRVIKDRDILGLSDTDIRPQIKAFVEKSRAISQALSKGLEHLFKKNNIDLFIGKASLKGPDSVLIRTEDKEHIFQAGNILIATGSHPISLKGVPFDGKRVLSSNDCVQLTSIPDNLLIAGGGAIGVEFASYFSVMGSKVTILEREDNILPMEDKEASTILTRSLKRKGVRILTSAGVKEVKMTSSGLNVTFEGQQLSGQEEFSHMLVSVGRRSSTVSLNLHEAGLEVGPGSKLEVGPDLRTKIPTILAAGDVIGFPMLAHSAYAEGELAAKVAAGLTPEELDPEHCPNAVYSSPQLASVGATEEDLIERNIKYSAGKAYFRANGKAAVNGQTEGFVKILNDTSSGRILGAHIVHDLASELIQELVLALNSSLTVKDITHSIHAHPTLSEAIAEAARSQYGGLLHG